LAAGVALPEPQPWSALTKISIGTTRGWLALSTLGRSMMAGCDHRRGDHEDHQQHQHESTYGTC